MGHIVNLQHPGWCTLMAALLLTKPPAFSMAGAYHRDENIHSMTGMCITRHPITLGVMKAPGTTAGPGPVSDVQPGKIQRRPGRIRTKQHSSRRELLIPNVSQKHVTPSFTIFNPRNPRWKKGHQIGIYISGRGIDPGTGLIFQSVSVPLWVSTHRLFHSFHEEMESGPPPISAKTKNLFLALAETTAQTFMVTSCYVCGGTNMGDQWPWEAKELGPQRPSYNSGEFKQTRVRIWCLKDFHNQQKLPGMVGPITQVFQ